ncbi:MAG TPA: GLPGLI family protein [Saprospiraceae bacterium]|nr:GLPGLI family protein [Saprospiraceae bacterium]
MIKHLYICFLFPWICLTAQDTQVDYAVYYQFQWMTDTVERTYAAPEEYLLYRVGEQSRFLNQHAYHNDSIMHYHQTESQHEIHSQAALDQFMAIHYPRQKRLTSELRVAKDFQTKKYQIVLYKSSNRHYLQEAFSLKWETLPGVDTIAGLPCYKATTQHGGRRYTAWYSPQIAIPDGPYVFQGLPGLITKVVDADQLYSFEIKTYQVKPERNYYLFPFIAQDYPLSIDRSSYAARSRKEKEDPVYPSWMPNVTPEQTLQLKEKRKTRFDLIIEKN